MEKLRVIAEIKAKLIEETSILLQLITKRSNSALEKFVQLEENIFRIQEKARESNEIPIEEYLQYLNQDDFFFSSNLSLLNTSECSAAINTYFSNNILESLTFVQAYSSSSLTKSMIFFVRNSKVLVNIDMQSLNLTKTKMNLKNRKGSHAGWCRLPGARVFHCGGQTGYLKKPLKSCFIIDKIANTLETMTNGPRKYTVGACAYLEDIVYVFGGSGILSVTLQNSEKFDLSTKEGTILQQLPMPSDYNSTSVQDRSIIITGCRLGAIIYKTGTNTYTEEMPSIFGHKIMISEGENVYILHSGSLIKRFYGQWNCINKTTGVPHEDFLVSYPVNYGNYIYFLLSSPTYTIYRFDILSKRTELVKHFDIL